MKIAAAGAIANCVSHPTRDSIIPPSLDEQVSQQVAAAVRMVALNEKHPA
jgi:malic enzyme